MNSNRLLRVCFVFWLGSVLLVNSGSHYPNRARDDLEQFKQQREQGMETMQRRQEEGIEALEQAYEEFYRKRRQAFEEFKNKVEARWGRAKTRLPSKKEWVSYSDDYNRRHGVDFEAGRAYAEVVVDKKQLEESPENVETKLRAEVKKLVTDTAPGDDVEDEVKEDEKSADEQVESGEKSDELAEPLVADQLSSAGDETAEPENADDYAEAAVSSGEVRAEAVGESEQDTRAVVSVEIPLVEDHLLKRARKFRDLVQQQARRFDVPASLIFALIQTESSFNPKARSHVPAYGLMQLVPKTGGKDAYRHVYGEGQLLGPGYLYDPANNVELGVAYLDLLTGTYFDGVKNSRSRQYCSIAAYNTGAGNVARTFVDSTNVKEAERKINSLSPEEVYARLRSSLPYEETRKYVKKVRNRRPDYRAWEIND